VVYILVILVYVFRTFWYVVPVKIWQPCPIGQSGHPDVHAVPGAMNGRFFAFNSCTNKVVVFVANEGRLAITPLTPPSIKYTIFHYSVQLSWNSNSNKDDNVYLLARLARKRRFGNKKTCKISPPPLNTSYFTIQFN
jgi:hypothetical protein